MVKKIKLGSEGMLKDISKSKFPGQMYFDARNIRIVATDQQSTYSITNEHGNTKIFTIPVPSIDIANKRIEYFGIDNVVKTITYKTSGTIVPRCEIESQFVEIIGGLPVAKLSGTQKTIGKAYSRDNVILFTTDDNGFDCVWELGNVSTNQPVTIELKYMRNMGFSINNPIQAIYNYENIAIEKVYWVDGKNQLRFLNLKQSLLNGDSENLIDLNSSVIDTVGKFDTSQPTLVSLTSGGSHTSGMIQYAYNLYRINGSQTSISPLSEMIALGKGMQGGDLNEVVSTMPIMRIQGIDINYTHIKIYSIKYTSYNQSPTISIVSDSTISNYVETQFSDPGISTQTISLSQFLFLGSNIFIPKHIESKNLRLFMFNIKDIKFNVDIDMRAYSHDQSGQAVVWSDVISDGIGGVTTNDPSSVITLNTNTYGLDENHDSINRNYDLYKFTKSGSVYGAEGKYIKISIDQSSFISQEDIQKSKFLKDRELYRFGIEFYNNKGQYSFPKWTSDIKAPDGNLSGLYNKVSVELKPEFYSWLNSIPDNDEKPVGYRILRSNRTESDKTIICQGLINPMIANLKKGGKDTDKTILANLANDSDSLKMPSLQRPLIKNQIPFIGANDYHELAYGDYSHNSFSNLGAARNREGFKAAPSGQWRAQNIQFNKMMQIFSPEVTFGNPIFNNSTILNIVGIQKESSKNNWASEYNPVSKINETEAKFTNGFTSDSPGVVISEISGGAAGLADKSIFGPTNTDNNTGVFQFFREFNNGFIQIPLNGINTADIYGVPEITEIGQDAKAYNGNSLFRYSNSLRGMLIDNFDQDSTNRNAECQILGTNTFGARCVTIMEGDNESTTPISSRKSIEKIFTDAKFHEVTGGSGQLGPVYQLGTGPNSAMVVELAFEKNHQYLGGIYGGNSIESKLKSNYLKIGEYSKISNNIVNIKSPGDTFVSSFKFAKMTKTDTELVNQDYLQMTEIISIPLETTVNLRMRNDISINDWDNRYQPKESEYHSYNRVYSQEPTLLQATGAGFKFRAIDEFDTKIISSSPKIAGEFIDNWTNFLDNETRTLDGRYGPINGVAKVGDEIFTFQDTGVAKISIEPRVQTSTSDGLSLQLGTGSVLNYHTYLTTESGTKNKWSIMPTSSGIYYYDAIIRSICKVGDGFSNITESLGFHSFMTNNTNFDELVKDNPLKETGISVGYNNIDNEVSMTFLQPNNSFTIAYNEYKKVFTSFYDYIPSMYISKGQKFITMNNEINAGWQHFTGERCSFYGTIYPSSITFLSNPGVNSDVVFGNAEYKMEVIDQNGIDVPNKTFSSIRSWNDYQDTGEVSLTNKSNIRRRFRNWSITLPRVMKNGNKSRDRIRNPWSYFKFTFNNSQGYKMISHDIVLSYTEY